MTPATKRPQPIQIAKRIRRKEDEWVEILRALGDATRLRILSSLVHKPLSVSEISEALELTQYNVSKHLRILRNHGIIKVASQGLYRYYRIEESLLRRVDSRHAALEFGCCTFRLEAPAK